MKVAYNDHLEAWVVSDVIGEYGFDYRIERFYLGYTKEQSVNEFLAEIAMIYELSGIRKEGK